MTTAIKSLTTSQSKQLLEAARKAVCFLDPSTGVYQDLKIALMRCEITEVAAPKAKEEKCCFCETPISANQAYFTGYSKKLKERKAHSDCAGRYDLDRMAAIGLAAELDANREKSRFTTKALMELCACGHKGDLHARDQQDNLLKCSDCDCEQFHYDNQPQVEDQAAA